MIKNKLNFLKPISPNEFTHPKFITIDIETILKNNVHIPYLYSMFDGNKSYSWFTSSPDSLFNELLRRKYRNFQIYAHNLSKFDIVFIFKYLGYLSFKYDIKIWKRESKIIMIRITRKKDRISLTIKDSLLLLPSSLNKLSKNFQISTPKLVEPVLITDISNTPGSDFYIMKDISHYTKEVLKMDNFLIYKKLIQEYCEVDCIALHEILIKFRKLIYENFEILIDHYPTGPSLAFGIYRMKYLKKDMISILDSEEDSFIRKSYTGGSTDTIIPYGVNVFVYDVNSLYPSVMASNEFPIGESKKFSNLNEIPDNSYWFAEVEVSIKEFLKIPYLQIHHNNRTISPNGSFKMIINSVEYYNALKDYNFKIMGGYFFKQENIFNNFVNDLYSLRLTYPKSDPMNLIAKLLMNSLYGRFGMKNQINNSFFVQSLDEIEMNNLTSITELDNDLFFIEIEEENMESKSNVAIASAVTSYSRVHMQKIKEFCIKNGIKIYYFDTDSIFTSEPLPDWLISNKLGDLKLEYVFKECVFLGPKIYAGITQDGEYICKIKGYKNSKSIPFEKMKSLLIENAFLNLSHTKWFRSFKDSNITLQNAPYNLKATENKRKWIYKNGKIVDSIPFVAIF